MRRGWMDWVAQEVPRETLAERVQWVADACAQRGLGALVLYSGFPRSAQMSALSHFVPFWSQALMVVTRTGRSLLTMATTGRTVQWIHTTSVVDEVRVGPDIGAQAAAWLAQQGLGDQAIGVADLADLPQAVYAGLQQGVGAPLEAGGWYAELAAGFGAVPAVAARAREIAHSALDGLAAGPWPHAHALVAALDGRCRALGAEEVAVYVAPDLAQDASVRRLEGPVVMGACVAVQLTLAYKGFWLRIGTSFEQDAGHLVPTRRAAAARALLADSAAQGASIDDTLSSLCAQLACSLESGRCEGVRGGLPLATLHEIRPGVRVGSWPNDSSLTLVLREPGGSRWLITHPKAAVSAA